MSITNSVFKDSIFRDLCQLYKNGEFYQANDELEGALISYSSCASIIHTILSTSTKKTITSNESNRTSQSADSISKPRVDNDECNDIVSICNSEINECIRNLNTLYQRVLSRVEQLQGKLKEQKQKYTSENKDEDENDWESACVKIHPTIFKKGSANCLFFSDLAGLVTQKRLIKEALIYPLIYPNLYPKVGKGFLLYGPPGTGKTLLVKAAVNQLQVIDPNVKVLFFSPTGATLKGKYVGETEKRITEAFKCASKAACQCEGDNSSSKYLSIIFIDEIDSIAKDRNNDETGLIANSVNTLLQMMDGIESPENVAVIGATNYPWLLDAAVLRRFDTQILLGLPQSSQIMDAMTLSFNSFIKLKLRGGSTYCQDTYGDKDEKEADTVNQCFNGCEQKTSDKSLATTSPYNLFEYEFIKSNDNRELNAIADEMSSTSKYSSFSDVAKVMNRAASLTATTSLDGVFYKPSKVFKLDNPDHKTLENFYISVMNKPNNSNPRYANSEYIKLITNYYNLLYNVIQGIERSAFNIGSDTNYPAPLSIHNRKVETGTFDLTHLKSFYNSFYLEKFPERIYIKREKNNKPRYYINSKLLIHKDPLLIIEDPNITDVYIYCELDKIIRLMKRQSVFTDPETINMMNLSKKERHDLLSNHTTTKFFKTRLYSSRPVDIIVSNTRIIQYGNEQLTKFNKKSRILGLSDYSYNTVELKICLYMTKTLYFINTIKKDFHYFLKHINLFSNLNIQPKGNIDNKTILEYILYHIFYSDNTDFQDKLNPPRLRRPKRGKPLKQPSIYTNITDWLNDNSDHKPTLKNLVKNYIEDYSTTNDFFMELMNSPYAPPSKIFNIKNLKDPVNKLTKYLNEINDDIEYSSTNVEKDKLEELRDIKNDTTIQLQKARIELIAAEGRILVNQQDRIYTNIKIMLKSFTKDKIKEDKDGRANNCMKRLKLLFGLLDLSELESELAKESESESELELESKSVFDKNELFEILTNDQLLDDYNDADIKGFVLKNKRILNQGMDHLSFQYFTKLHLGVHRYIQGHYDKYKQKEWLAEECMFVKDFYKYDFNYVRDIHTFDKEEVFIDNKPEKYDIVRYFDKETKEWIYAQIHNLPTAGNLTYSISKIQPNEYEQFNNEEEDEDDDKGKRSSKTTPLTIKNRFKRMLWNSSYVENVEEYNLKPLEYDPNKVYKHSIKKVYHPYMYEVELIDDLQEYIKVMIRDFTIKKGYLKDFQTGNAKPSKKKSSKENPFKEIINYMLHCIFFLRFILINPGEDTYSWIDLMFNENGNVTNWDDREYDMNKINQCLSTFFMNFLNDLINGIIEDENNLRWKDLNLERFYNTKPIPPSGTLDSLTVKLWKYVGDKKFKHVSIYNKIMSRSLPNPKGDLQDYYDIVDKHAGSDIVIVNYLNTELSPSVDSQYTLDNKSAWDHIKRDIDPPSEQNDSEWEKKRNYLLYIMHSILYYTTNTKDSRKSNFTCEVKALLEERISEQYKLWYGSHTASAPDDKARAVLEQLTKDKESIDLQKEITEALSINNRSVTIIDIKTHLSNDLFKNTNKFVELSKIRVDILNDETGSNYAEFFLDAKIDIHDVNFKNILKSKYWVKSTFNKVSDILLSLFGKKKITKEEFKPMMQRIHKELGSQELTMITYISKLANSIGIINDTEGDINYNKIYWSDKWGDNHLGYTLDPGIPFLSDIALEKMYSVWEYMNPEEENNSFSARAHKLFKKHGVIMTVAIIGAVFSVVGTGGAALGFFSTSAAAATLTASKCCYILAGTAMLCTLVSEAVYAGDDWFEAVSTSLKEMLPIIFIMGVGLGTEYYYRIASANALAAGTTATTATDATDATAATTATAATDATAATTATDATAVSPAATTPAATTPAVTTAATTATVTTAAPNATETTAATTATDTADAGKGLMHDLVTRNVDPLLTFCQNNPHTALLVVGGVFNTVKGMLKDLSGGSDMNRVNMILEDDFGVTGTNPIVLSLISKKKIDKSSDKQFEILNQYINSINKRKTQKIHLLPWDMARADMAMFSYPSYSPDSYAQILKVRNNGDLNQIILKAKQSIKVIDILPSKIKLAMLEQAISYDPILGEQVKEYNENRVLFLEKRNKQKTKGN